MTGYNIGIVGASGVVGKELIKLLEKKSLAQKLFPIKHLFLFASERSERHKVLFKGEFLPVEKIEPEALQKLDLVFFMAGAEISKTFIPLIDRSKTIVIDSSSAFRMDPEVPLSIPEINPYDLENHDNLIASPNCTALIMLMALYSLHKAFKINRIVASTYQAASGGGAKLLQKLEDDTKNYAVSTPKENHYFGYNLFLHESKHSSNKYSEEELKIIEETRKILVLPDLKIAPTCVRVPVLRAHSMSLNVQFKKSFSLKKVLELLNKAKGVEIFEDFEKNEFATPLMATEKENIYISRVRIDPTQDNTLEMWVVGDQLLKGAALNLLQIAEIVLKPLQTQKRAGSIKERLALVTG